MFEQYSEVTVQLVHSILTLLYMHIIRDIYKCILKDNESIKRLIKALV